MSSVTRRRFLQTSAVTAAITSAGCIGAGTERRPTTYLDDPDPQIESEEKAYPGWGQRLPTLELHAPLHDREVSIEEFTGRDVFLTFFYSHCQTVCPRLVSTLRNVQSKAIADGYGADVAFLAVTFDPQRDTATRLRTYADTMNVDRNAGNWYFLRPDSPDRAKRVVQETYGVGFKRTHPEGMDRYMFSHLGLILLANRQQYVERAFMTTTPTWQEIYDDFETLRRREG